jgi:site-specific DNA recombinase
MGDDRDDAVSRAQWGDLTGLSLAGMVRMSHELTKDGDDVPPSNGSRRVPVTGDDIKGRDVQAQDCSTYVTKRGGRYVFTYEEPDTSAWKRRRVRQPDGTVVWRVLRPVFEGALEDLKRGISPNGERLDGLVVYDLDRLTRDNRHLEDAIDVVTHHRRPILDTTGSIDLLTENGRSMARVLVAMSNKQSADTARRVARKHRAMQQAGIPTGGRRAFGWQEGKRTLNPEEAAAIREGAERILRGAPTAAVVIDWNERGIRTVTGRLWTVDTVKLIYRNPRVCGYRSRIARRYNHESGTETAWVEVVRDADGEPVQGQWQPILSAAEWEAVVALIGARADNSRGTNTRKYLLTGTLRCGRDECNARLRATKAPKTVKTPGLYYYGCPGKAAGGCGGLSIAGPATDEHVIAAVIAKYETEAKLRAAPEIEPWVGESRLSKVRQDIRDLTDAWRAESISGGRYFALLSELESEERQLTGDREKWIAASRSAGARPVDIRINWPAYTLAEKRAYIQDALIAVIVKPANGHAGRIGERLRPIWRED